jgi:hypothetical protein
MRFGLSLAIGAQARASVGQSALSLNFLSGTLDSRITFTRSTTATFVGSNGLLQSSAINAPRFDYNPATLAPRGLLIEEQRVNLVLYSAEFDNAGWAKLLTTATGNATTSPDGTTNADRLTADGTLGGHQVQQGVTFTEAAHTLTVYAKRDTNDFVQVRFGAAAIAAGTGFANFDLNAGTVGTIGPGVTAASITPAGNGWYRCTITGTTLAAVSNAGFYIVTSATATTAEANTLTTSVFLYGAQLEAGSFATSYIPTVASTVTRAADDATMTGTNFSSWYNAGEGTIVTNFGPFFRTTGNPGVAQIDDGSANNTIRTFAGSVFSPVFNVIVGEVNQAFLNVGTVNPNAITSIAGAYALNNFAKSVNGLAPDTDASGTVPVVNRMLIGSGTAGVNYLNGYMRSITFYPQRLANAQLQALTS